MGELPKGVQLAASQAGLEAFLQDVPVGFHWDILDRMEDGVYLVDRERRIRYWSQSAERITGFAAQEVLGKRCADEVLCHVDDAGRHLCQEGCPLAATMEDGRPRSAEVFLHHKSGHRTPVKVYGAPIYNEAGQVIGAFETFSQTSSVLAAHERIGQLEELAFVDTLTGIGNRRYLERELTSRLADLQRLGWRFGVVLCDIDHFKRFNDEFGHATGDEALQMVAQTLAHGCRAGDCVGRWGGEEFLVVIGNLQHGTLWQVAERLRLLLASSFLRVKGANQRVTVSAGAVMAQPGEDIPGLLARADGLLYQSKTAGRNRISVEPG